ncbi:hypothetical protein B5X24_HaOG207012 [Helicoverpa armigera]|uniref:FP protein C-terminal domain-containing protein n=3 Tax=Helicoverpa armigera TaxID=29058 RepID=A0A2W1BT79_HELAM|nr:hypothetical protein B5X24_HaOG207012 [Helicoverpa armigera]
MFTCKRCDVQSRDGAMCVSCKAKFDFPCAGITEAGWRRLGERKLTWRCQNCKAAPVASPQTGNLKTSPANSETIMLELQDLSSKLEALPALMESVKVIQRELAELKTIRQEVSEMKLSFESYHREIQALTSKVTDLEDEIESMKKTKEAVVTLQDRIAKLERLQSENEQRSRMNNIEIKGVPMSKDEDLFAIMAKIGEAIDFNVQKEQINYIARVPTRNDKVNKNIICSVHNSYLKNDFITAAKKHKKLHAGDLGFQGSTRVYINDHLTLENKLLLNKTKVQAAERGFEHVWVRGCKILVRKNSSSPKYCIKTEQDLKKFVG